MINQNEDKHSIINNETIVKLKEESYQREIKLLNDQINYFNQQVKDNREKINLFLESIDKLTSANTKLTSENTKLTSEIRKSTSENTKLILELKNMKYQNQDHDGIGDIVGRDKIITNNYYNQDESQLAQDIQTLLEELDKNHDTNTLNGKMMIAAEAIKHIENNNNFKSRIIKSLSSGGTAALASLLNHPAASFLIEAIKTWRQSKK